MELGSNATFKVRVWKARWTAVLLLLALLAYSKLTDTGEHIVFYHFCVLVFQLRFTAEVHYEAVKI